MNKFLLLTAGLALALSTGALAQAPPGGGVQPGGSLGPDPTPIDGGVSLLLASGAAYAVKRLRRRARR